MLGFVYKDGEQSVEVEKNTLMKVLSTGERKALYILNVIFEIERRKKEKVETLLIVDDIADSFDYNNKYAIIQYLKDITEDGLFKLIIMTHNFDFFRTVQSRFVPYVKCLMASKGAGGISLVRAAGIKNVFANDWKGNFFSDPRKKIASIPFLRNLIEMTRGEGDDRYLKLTSMLHRRADTGSLTIGDLDEIFNSLCGTADVSADADRNVADLIVGQADACSKEGGALRLENKIVLAIGIRLESERYVISRIKDNAFVSAIAGNQTRELIVFKRDFSNEDAALGVLDRVELMTPENIHVNSFMYEPIIDMGDDHLRDLYIDVKGLQ